MRVHSCSGQRGNLREIPKDRASSGLGIKNGKVSGKVGAWGLQKSPSGGPGCNASGGGQGAKPPEAF